MNDVNYDVQDRSKDVHSCFQSKQMSTYIYVDNLIKRNRAFRVLGENVFEKIELRTCLFFSSGKWRVCAVTKLLQITLYSILKGIQ